MSEKKELCPLCHEGEVKKLSSLKEKIIALTNEPLIIVDPAPVYEPFNKIAKLFKTLYQCQRCGYTWTVNETTSTK